MTMQKADKRGRASSSSGQSSQPKRQCFCSVNQATHATENILTARTSLTLEDVRRVVREELERHESIVNARNENRTHPSMEETVKKLVRLKKPGQVKEALEQEHVHPAYLPRNHTKSGEMNHARNLQLHFMTKLPPIVYTGSKLKGEHGDAIRVTLIDATTKCDVSSGPASSIKLDALVLDGDFNKDDNDNWTREEFENNVVKARGKKGLLLKGNCRVVLKDGKGFLSDLIFNDNSSWIPSQKFRIGLKALSGCCENVEIREAVTEAFSVKEQRGESYRKHYPPLSDDAVWRLEKIAKDGKFHQKLDDAGIRKVEDFLLELFRDSEKLKENLGMTKKNWNNLVDHAKTCTPSGKLYVYYEDDTRNRGVVLNNTCQLSGVMVNGEFFASHTLCASDDKEYAESLMREARDNWNRVEHSHDEAFLESIQHKHSGSFAAEVDGGQSENPNSVLHFPSQVANAVGGDASLLLVQSSIEGHDGTTAVSVALPVPSPSSFTHLSEQEVDDLLRQFKGDGSD